MYIAYFKPIFDFFLALILLFILSPLFLALGLLSRYHFKAAFFIQPRVGKDEQIFNIYKFKSMSDKGFISKYGKVLRASSLDELPQLLNVLKGDMSFIGPRPLLVEYLKLYSKKQRKRHRVKPGLSGLAQIKGRNTLSWESRFKLDLFYIQKMSFLFDLKLICLTMIKLFSIKEIKKAGINAKKFKS